MCRLKVQSPSKWTSPVMAFAAVSPMGIAQSHIHASRTRTAALRGQPLGAPARPGVRLGLGQSQRQSKLVSRVAEIALQPQMQPEPEQKQQQPQEPELPDTSQMSYSQQYDALYQQQPLPIKKMQPKPNKEAQAEVPGAKKVLLSDVYGLPKRPLFKDRTYNEKDKGYLGWMIFVHGLALLAPFTFSWANVGLFFVMYFITGCLGITLSYHRMLSHKSFTAPKWLEYALAYCGVLSVEGDLIEWVSSHRYHHMHCDTPLDPHSPYEGFWWSHMGWLLDNKTTLERVHDRRNASDLEAQPFYRWIRDTYMWHVVAQLAALYAIGGLGGLVWGGALRMVWVYHVTWFVNSASHCWGTQTYNTGDLSRNNWWVGILAWGEGWHNNHHAFESSARHGLEWWQVDITWYIIAAMEKLKMITIVKLPSEKAKARLAFPKAA